MAARKKQIWIELQRAIPGGAADSRHPIQVRITAITAFYAKGSYTVVEVGGDDPVYFHGLQSEFREAIG